MHPFGLGNNTDPTSNVCARADTSLGASKRGVAESTTEQRVASRPRSYC